MREGGKRNKCKSYSTFFCTVDSYGATQRDETMRHFLFSSSYSTALAS